MFSPVLIVFETRKVMKTYGTPCRIFLEGKNFEWIYFPQFTFLDNTLEDSKSIFLVLKFGNKNHLNSTILKLPIRLVCQLFVCLKPQSYGKLLHNNILQPNQILPQFVSFACKWIHFFMYMSVNEKKNRKKVSSYITIHTCRNKIFEHGEALEYSFSSFWENLCINCKYL